jgi:hypothetical protein
MKTITKALVGTVAAGAVAISSATPALARDRDNGISTGEVIAGALILGGIAAVVASSNNNNDRYDDRGYSDRYDDRYGDYNSGDYRRGYGSGYNSREAVEQCVNAAERSANRYSYGGRADVTDIRSVQRTRGGFNVRGRIAVNTSGRNWRNGDRNYGNGWNGDYRGANQRLRGYDSGSFTCKVQYGRIADLDFSGIRGLR